MNVRRRLRLFAPAVAALAILAGPLAGSAAAATSSGAPASVAAGQVATAPATVSSWRWVGWYPDPVLCVAVGAATYLPFECRFNFPWGWSLHVWI